MSEYEIHPGDFVEVKLELQAVQSLVKRSILARADTLAKLVDEEVERSLTPERLEIAIRECVEQEFKNSMTYGDGYRHVAKIVKQQVAETMSRLAKTSP